MHPYYPTDAQIADYIPNEWDTLTLVSIFTAICTAIFALASLSVKKIHPRISSSDLWTIIWFIISGCIHLILEGYYVYNFRSMGGNQDLLGQLWKEYALSDSRYLTQDAFVLCMESITAICWGPLCFILPVMITTNHPLRHPLQALVSLGQLYGDVLYYATSGFDWIILGREYSRPEYFWGYFVFCNTFWIVIPAVLLFSSIRASGKAFAAAQKMDKIKVV